MKQTREKLKNNVDSLSLDVLKFVLVIVIIVLTWSIYYIRNFEGLAVLDALDMAQVARHVATGQGLVTQFIRPHQIPLYSGEGLYPDYYHSPFYILFLSCFFRWFDINSLVVVGVSLFSSFLVCMGVFFVLWRRISFNWALAGMLVCGLSPGFIEAAFSGLSIALMALVFLFFYLVLGIKGLKSSTKGFVLGLIWGILCLSDLDFFFLFPLVLLVIHLSLNSRKGFCFFIGAFLIVLSPWLIRNLVAAGNPFVSGRWVEFYSWTRTLPGNRVFRDMNWVSTMVSWGEVLNKFLGFFRLMSSYWIILGGIPIIVLFLFSLVSVSSRKNRINYLVGLLFLGEMVLIPLTDPNSVMMLLVFSPVIGIISLEFLALYFSRHLQRRLFSKAIVLTILCFPGIATAYIGMSSFRYAPPGMDKQTLSRLENGDITKQIREIVKPDEIIISDSPWALAWFSDRLSIWIPWELSQVKQFRKDKFRIEFLHLTPIVNQYPKEENIQAWVDIYLSGKVPSWLGFDKGIILPGEELLLGRRVFERIDLE